MKWSTIGCLVILLGCLVIPLVSPVVWDEWPMFRYDETNSGYGPNTVPRDNATVWIFDTPGRVFSSPVVADGAVFVGSDDSKVYAINQTTGMEIWNYTTGGYVRSSPTVAGGFDGNRRLKKANRGREVPVIARTLRKKNNQRGPTVGLVRITRK